MRSRIGSGGFAAEQTAHVGGDGVAGVSFIGVHDGVEVLEGAEFPIRHAGIRQVGDVQLGGGAGIGADGDAFLEQLINRSYAELDLGHDALAIVEGGGDRR